MLIKEFIQVLRDPRMRTVIFVIPCVQMLVIGYAVTTDVKHVPTAVYDLDNSQASRELTARFVGLGLFRRRRATSTATAPVRELLDRGDGARWCCGIDHGFADDLRPAARRSCRSSSTAPTRTRPGSCSSYAGKIAAEYSPADPRRPLRAGRGAGSRRAGRPAARAWFNENLESRNYFVPGVIVIVVTLVTLLLTSMAVVREKEIGTIEQIMVTPIRPMEFILGKTVPFALIGIIDVIAGDAGGRVLVRRADPRQHAAAVRVHRAVS